MLLTGGSAVARRPPLCKLAAASVGRLRRRGRGGGSEKASFRLDVGRPDHLTPLLGFVGDELAEIGG
jgi:hypothetical protein